MVSSKKTAIVSVETLPVRSIARTPPPAFLFPNQRCQRPEPADRPHRLTPGGRRRRLSSRLGFPCQSAFSGFFLIPGEPGQSAFSPPALGWIRAQKSLRAAEGLPRRSVAIRLEGRRLCGRRQKIKWFFNPSRSAPPRLQPGSGVSIGRRSRCQSTLAIFAFRL